jgi:glycosyltransferase involved in cell wall biosynthesis
MKNLTLVIPAKSEEYSLPKVLHEIKNINCKKLIVLSKSDLSTIPLIKNFKCKIIIQKNTGYGNALKDGINNVATDYLCIFNADGSFKPNEIENMRSNLIKNKLNFIFASRYKKDGKSDDDTFLTKLGNYFFTALGKIFFSIKITDILYTYVLGETKKFQKLKINSNDFSFCIELPIKIERNKMKYSCIASHERKRISGIKKVNEIKDGFKILCKMIYFFFKK